VALDQFRSARRTRGEIAQHRIVDFAARWLDGVVANPFAVLIVQPSRAVSDCDADTEYAQRLEFLCFRSVGNDMAHIGPVDPFSQISRFKRHGCRQDDRTDFHDGEHGFPEFYLITKHQKNHIPLFHAYVL